MSAVRIRLATPEDVPRLNALARQLGYPGEEDALEERLAALAADPDSAVFVAVNGDLVAGWIQVSVSRLLESAPRAEVRGLVVDEARRGAGIGSKLLARAEAWAKDRGLTKLRVPCNVTRTRAHAFYLREGFVEHKVQRIFERNIE